MQSPYGVRQAADSGGDRRRTLTDVELEFTGRLVEWRGPAPFFFVPLPEDEAELVDQVKAGIAYWGVVPVTARIGDTEFTTAMFPREGTWFLPVKVAVRRAEHIELDHSVRVTLRLGRTD